MMIRWMAITVALALVGCTTVNQAVQGPVKPSGYDSGSKRYVFPFMPLDVGKQPVLEVDSLTPILRWEGFPGATYDLVIYQAVEVERYLVPKIRMPGPKVYYREGLTDTEHKVETVLREDQLYFWSVRTRSNDVVSDWARPLVHTKETGPSTVGAPITLYRTLVYPYLMFETPEGNK